MSRFYGTVQGNRGQATRCGNASSGLTTETAGWDGCIEVTVYDRDGDGDGFIVSMQPWMGSGDKVGIASGIIGNSSSIRLGKDVFEAHTKKEIAKRACEMKEEVSDDWDSYP